jgi:hypothetical protein
MFLHLRTSGRILCRRSRGDAYVADALGQKERLNVPKIFTTVQRLSQSQAALFPIFLQRYVIVIGGPFVCTVIS